MNPKANTNTVTTSDETTSFNGCVYKPSVGVTTIFKTMKTTIILLFAFLINAVAQEAVPVKQSSFLISLSGGTAIPLGDYANASDYRNNGNGFANMGYYAKLDVTYMLIKYAGITANFNYMNNGYNTSKYSDEFSDYLVSSGTMKPTYTGVTIDNWKLQSYLFGPCLNLPLDKEQRASITVKALAGIAITSTPDIFAYSGGYDMSGTDDIYLNFKLNNQTVKSFAFEINSSLKFAISKHLFIAFNGSYFRTKLDSYTTPAFVEATSYSAGQYASQSAIKTITNTISNALVGFSFGVKF